MLFSRTKGFTLIELLVVIVIIGLLAAIALPNYIKVKEKAKEAEVKANLHNIQLSVERFAVDTEGSYPNYLIGGEAKFARTVQLTSSANAFSDITQCTPLEGVSDPLLRRGYVDAYPRNPFTRNGIAIHQVQTNLPTSAYNGSDPLRNGTDGENNSTKMLGTRFGAYCTSMGSVLCDARFQMWTYMNIATGIPENRDTRADIEYQFWDMWKGNKPLPFLPGQFFYKGNGPIVAVGTNDASAAPILPTEIDSYMMGGYGGIRTKGNDVLGPEHQIIYTARTAGSGSLAMGDGNFALQPPPPGPGPGTGTTQRMIWPWTRSQRSATAYDGSPYQPALPSDSNEQLQYGNPNGIRDGLVLVLTAGEDYNGQR